MKIVETSQCGVSMCFLPAGVFGTPWPPFYSPCPLRRGKGEAQSGAGFGSGRLTSGRLAAGRCPPFKGVGGFRNYLPNWLGFGRCHQKKLAPFYSPLPPQKGEAQSDAGLGSGRLASGRLASGRCPPFKGVGGFRNYFPNRLSGRPASGRCLQNV